MAIKTKHLDKFFIEQFVINDDNFNKFKDDNMLKNLLYDNAIVGFIFTNKNMKFSSVTVLNLYLIKRDYYDGYEVTLDALSVNWELFFQDKKEIVFENPPIKLWLDTKDNWCKKLANRFAKQFDKTYSEMLSEVYYTIMRLYKKGTVYMGNLGYIERSVYNSILCRLRLNRKRVNQDSGLAVSLDAIISDDNDDESLTLEDMIAYDDSYDEDNITYNETKENCLKLLRESFSDREINIILTTNATVMPRTIYERLRYWRSKHNVEDIYE